MTDVVVVDRSEYTTCTVNLHGCIITSWRIRNIEQLFGSREVEFDGKSFVTGGIPIGFPHFGPWPFGPDTGFARVVDWVVEEEPVKLLSDDIITVFSLSDTPYTRSLWNFQFKILYKLILKEKALDIIATIKNTSPHFDMYFVFLLHASLRVPNITQCELIGLKNNMYLDLAAEEDPKFQNDENDVTVINQYTNRLYKNAPDQVILTNGVHGNSFKIKKRNLPDLMVWNPWSEKAAQIKHFGNDEYMKMINIEPSRYFEKIRLLPGESHTVSISISVFDPNRSEDDEDFLVKL